MSYKWYFVRVCWARRRGSFAVGLLFSSVLYEKSSYCFKNSFKQQIIDCLDDKCVTEERDLLHIIGFKLLHLCSCIYSENAWELGDMGAEQLCRGVLGKSEYWPTKYCHSPRYFLIMVLSKTSLLVYFLSKW